MTNIEENKHQGEADSNSVLSGNERENTHRMLESLVYEALSRLPETAQSAFEAVWIGASSYIFSHQDKTYEVIRDKYGHRIRRSHKIIPKSLKTEGSPFLKVDISASNLEEEALIYFTTAHIPKSEILRGIERNHGPAFGYKDTEWFPSEGFNKYLLADPFVNTIQAAERIREFCNELKAEPDITQITPRR